MFINSTILTVANISGYIYPGYGDISNVHTEPKLNLVKNESLERKQKFCCILAMIKFLVFHGSVNTVNK